MTALGGNVAAVALTILFFLINTQQFRQFGSRDINRVITGMAESTMPLSRYFSMVRSRVLSLCGEKLLDD